MGLVLGIVKPGKTEAMVPRIRSRPTRVAGSPRGQLRVGGSIVQRGGPCSVGVQRGYVPFPVATVPLH